MLWLVAALPLATVVAGVATLVLAAGGPDATSPDAVRRTGQQQVADLAPDLVAARRGLRAVLDVAADGRAELRVAAPGGAPLRLALHHPTDAARDRAFELTAVGGGRYAARVGALAGVDWNVVVSAHDRSWRLVGRLPRAGRRVELAPRFGAPP
jgi:hypothetical protein